MASDPDDAPSTRDIENMAISSITSQSVKTNDEDSEAVIKTENKPTDYVDDDAKQLQDFLPNGPDMDGNPAHEECQINNSGNTAAGDSIICNSMVAGTASVGCVVDKTKIETGACSGTRTSVENVSTAVPRPAEKVAQIEISAKTSVPSHPDVSITTVLQAQIDALVAEQQQQRNYIKSFVASQQQHYLYLQKIISSQQSQIGMGMAS